MSIKPQAARRRGSYVEIASNPLEKGEKEVPKEKIEIIGDARPITAPELTEIIQQLENEKYLYLLLILML
jgi:hypothetical protein